MSLATNRSIKKSSKTQSILDNLKELSNKSIGGPASVIRQRAETESNILGTIDPVSIPKESLKSSPRRSSKKSQVLKNLENIGKSTISVAAIGELVPRDNGGNNYLRYIKYSLAIIIGLFLVFWLLKYILDYFGVYIYGKESDEDKKKIVQKLKKKKEKDHKKKREERQKKDKEDLKKLIKKDLEENKKELNKKGGSFNEEKMTLEKALNQFKNNNNKKNVASAPMFDDATSKMQSNRNPNKSGYCYIGEDRGFRSCLFVNSGNNCVSGDIFPTQEICVNPNLRYQMDG